MPVWVEGAAEAEFSFISYEHQCSIFLFLESRTGARMGLAGPSHKPTAQAFNCLFDGSEKES